MNVTAHGVKCGGPPGSAKCMFVAERPNVAFYDVADEEVVARLVAGAIDDRLFTT